MRALTAKKVAVVQAGTSGIGLAVAHRLVVDGYFVIVSSRRESNVARAVSFLQAAAGSDDDVVGVVGHAAREEDRVALADTATSVRADGAVHALVCNAATSVTYGPLLETDAVAWSKMLDTNVTASAMTVRLFATRKAFAPGASVVLVSSIGGYAPLPGLGAYSVTKTALLGLCRVLAAELAPDARVNCVAPGIIRTAFSEVIWRPWEEREVRGGGGEGIQDSGGGAKHLLTDVPLRRLGTPEDVSGVVAFLLSTDASYVTGETISVAGGIRSRL